MSHGKELVPIFARCFRSLAKLNAILDDIFFTDLLDHESEKLLRSYLTFLKHEGTIDKNNQVAQCRQAFICQIKNLLELLAILKHLRLTEHITPLLLERDLLLLESAILSDPTSNQTSYPRERKPAQELGKDSLSHVHQQMSQFVASREQIQNIEVFAKFSGIAKRTLKRKLSELVEAGIIKRLATGKKVFYEIVSKLPS